MELVKTEEAVGHVLCHDITQIIKGVKKDAIFRKGHVVSEADISVLLSVGKEHLYVWENSHTILHENEAAEILGLICRGRNMHLGEVKEGKIELIADCDGLLKIDKSKLNEINQLGEMMIASRHGGFSVKKGDVIAGTRIIPLLIEREKMDKVKLIGGNQPVFNILPYHKKYVGVVTTGSEVYKGRIKDTFTPVIEEKLYEYGLNIVEQRLCSDDHQEITKAIHDLIQKGCNMIICTGGMSVDPDDRTPLAIKNVGVEVITYGAPVLPGAMFMLAYYEKRIPILGLPGCVMYSKRTIFDIMLPRILCDEILNASDFNQLGEGGLCLTCLECTYPNCGFGK